MMQWISGTFQLGAMLLVLLALAQWPMPADAGPDRIAPQAQQAAAGTVPAHLGWMLEQHWRVANRQ